MDDSPIFDRRQEEALTVLDMVKKTVRGLNIVFAGLLALSLLILQALLSLGAADLALLLSTIGFAAAIPLLVGALWMNRDRDRDQPNPFGKAWWIYLLVTFSSIILAIVATAAALWHVSWIATLVFLVVTMLVCIAYFFHAMDLRQGMSVEEIFESEERKSMREMHENEEIIEE